MTAAFLIVLVLHGLIHFLGFAKAFGLADLPQLTQPISPLLGAAWLIAGLMFLAAAVSVFAWPRWWWAIGACASLVSTFVIVISWSDAKFGALGNLIVFIGVACGLFGQGPFSLRAAYDRDVARGLARAPAASPISEMDLARLPTPVQRYLRLTGVVGQPRVYNVHVRMHGRIRNSPDTRWISLMAEQYNFIEEPARLFYFTGSMFAIPVQGYHRYVGVSATMTVRAAAFVPVADVSGREMSQGETVTMFNDMCVLAPATLIDPAIVWEGVDPRTANATFTNGGHTIRATLSFNDAGELMNFWSDDRYQTAPDGKSLKHARWSTPLSAYRRFQGVLFASRGAAKWHEPSREYTYLELTIDDVEYNIRAR
jgi:hypothetical protein